MAHFFDASSKERTGKIKAYEGTKVTFGLWGGGPETPSKPLIVTTKPNGKWNDPRDPAITPVSSQLGSWTFIYQVDLRLAAGRKIRAICSQGDWSEPLIIESLGPAPKTSDLKIGIRKAIVDEALSHVGRAHYLWGTAGNTPTLNDGNFGKIGTAKVRDYSLDESSTNRDKVLAVNMAYQGIFDSYNSCAGRCKRAGIGVAKELSQYKSDHQADIASKKPTADWGTPSELHPRKYYFRGTLQAGGGVVWGESCYGRKHFDCIGLVNYCIAKHFTGKAYANEIAAFKSPNSGAVPIFDSNDLMDADILIPAGTTKHIAFLYNAGANIWKIVQATQTEVGLTSSELYEPAKWDRFRMLDVYLK
jgi:hypothetical protein